MEFLLLILAGGGGAAFLGKKLRLRQREQRSRREELEAVRTLADEDVTLLGEELRRLDSKVSGHELDEDARVDYQTALDAYEQAGRTVCKLRTADEISLVTDTLATGRYALACVQARVAGLPVPERRTPCFFNPQHGPSVKEIMWTGRGRGSRMVPACAQDAARVAAGERPEVRMVRVGDHEVAYWEAGAAFSPYVHGYYVASSAHAFQQHASASGLFGAMDGFSGADGGN